MKLKTIDAAHECRGQAGPPPRQNRGASPSLLSEEFFDLLHPGLGAGLCLSLSVWLIASNSRSNSLCPVGQIHRRFDDDVASRSPCSGCAHREYLCAQPEYLPRLSFAGDSDSPNRPTSGFRSLRRAPPVAETDRHFAVQVVVIALKDRMNLTWICT